MTSSIDVTPENFVHAVQMLYHDQDATRKKLASEWLLSVQSSLYAWTLADQLIRMNQNAEVTCLSAQILRHKIQHNFDELPVEHCKALCDSLLDHLSRAELTCNTTVRIQLAVATADLALQYVGWEKPVEDVVEKLKTSSEHMLTLLEFLTALPEEVNTSTIRIGENRRRYCREKYSNCGKQIHEILIFLLQVSSSPNETLFIGILKCFA
jgi:transportin-3